MTDTLTCNCRFCGNLICYAKIDAGSQMICPRCKQWISLPAALTPFAVIQRQRKKSTPGLMLEVGGFALMIWFPIGTIAGLALLIIGWRQSFAKVCGNCGAPVKDPSQANCGRCKAVFTVE